jgi:hypothetical protein
MVEVSGQAGERDETQIVISVCSLFDWAMDEVLEFFSDPPASGMVLSQ